MAQTVSDTPGKNPLKPTVLPNYNFDNNSLFGTNKSHAVAAKPKPKPKPQPPPPPPKPSSKTTKKSKHTPPPPPPPAPKPKPPPEPPPPPPPQALPGGWYNFNVLEDYRVIDTFDSDFTPESLDYVTGSPYSDQIPDGSVGGSTPPPNVSVPPPPSNLVFDIGLSNADLQKRVRVGGPTYDYSNTAWGGIGQPRFVLDRAVWDIVIDLPPKEGFDSYEVRIVEA